MAPPVRQPVSCYNVLHGAFSGDLCWLQRLTLLQIRDTIIIDCYVKISLTLKNKTGYVGKNVDLKCCQKIHLNDQIKLHLNVSRFGM